MVYTFMTRDPKSALSKEVARAVVNGGVKWSGDPAVRDILNGWFFYSLGEAFDENNPKHWEKLPDIISGSRFWVVKQKEKAKLTFKG